MPANGAFITGRGPRWWEADLVRALTERRDAPPCSTSPARNPRAGHPYYRRRTFGSPPYRGSTGHEVERMSRYILEEFRRLRQVGEPALYEVTLPMLSPPWA